MSSDKIFFGYPYYDKVNGSFMGCVTRMIVRDLMGPRLLVNAQGVDGVYVSNNRNILVREMLKSPATWLLMADTDTVFKDDLPRRMVQAANEEQQDAKVISVDLPLGGIDHTGMNRLRPGVWVPSKRDYGWHDGAATAIFLVHRYILQGMADNEGAGCWFLHRYYREGVEWLDEKEDMAFASRCLDLGIKTWVTNSVWAKHEKRLQLPNRLADDGSGLVSIAPPKGEAK